MLNGPLQQTSTPTFAPKRHVEYLVDNWGKWSWKTTTIGKLPTLLKSGYKCLIGAPGGSGGASENLGFSKWNRGNCQSRTNTDPAAVVFDDRRRTIAGNRITLVDTAGRLQNKKT